jgi:hypothetical protein
MRKLAIALVAATTVGTALPAAAQVGFYAGPDGIGVGGDSILFATDFPEMVHIAIGPSYFGRAKGCPVGPAIKQRPVRPPASLIAERCELLVQYSSWLDHPILLAQIEDRFADK